MDFLRIESNGRYMSLSQSGFSILEVSDTPGTWKTEWRHLCCAVVSTTGTFGKYNYLGTLKLLSVLT